MKRIILNGAGTFLVVLLSACNPLYGYDPSLSASSVTVEAPASATAMLSGRSVSLAAGSTAHVTFGLRLNCADNPSGNLTEDGCQYVIDGEVRPHTEPLTVSMAMEMDYYDNGVLKTNPHYPTKAEIPGLTFTFAEDRLTMHPPHGSISTTDLAITADANAVPGTYTVYVGKPVGTNVLDTALRQPLTITVTTPTTGPMSTLSGQIPGYDLSWTSPEVRLGGYGDDLVTAPVDGSGNFSAPLPTPASSSLSPFTFDGCEGTISANGTLHTGGSVMFYDGGTWVGSLTTAGPTGYELGFLLYVDRAVTVDMTCSSGSYVYDYDFPAAGWYPVFVRYDESTSTSSYTALHSDQLTGVWSVLVY